MIYQYLIVAFLGLVLGSYAGATVWRLRALQLSSENEEYTKLKDANNLSDDEAQYFDDLKNSKAARTHELKRLQPIQNASFSKDRSHCLHCHHELKAIDLIPLVSWLSTRGRCRYCNKPIGWFEPVIEIATALSFLAFYSQWVAANGFLGALPVLLLWLSAIVMLIILFAYDAKWFILPDRVIFPLIFVSIAIWAVTMIKSNDPISTLWSTLGAVLILSGLYLALWLISRGRWVGFGDVKLGLALALLLADWQLAFLTLLLANLIGTLLVLPSLMRGRMGRGTQVPFGPLLILGFAISLLYGAQLISAFQQLTFVAFTA